MSSADHARLGTTFRLIFALCLVVCLAAAILTSRWIAADTRDFIYEAFNEEQTIIARNARDAVQRALEGVELELLIAVSEIDSIEAATAGDIDPVLGGGLARLQQQNVRWIAARAGNAGPARILHRFQSSAEPLSARDSRLSPAGIDSLAAGEILCGEAMIEKSMVVVRLAARHPATGAVVVCEMELTRFLAPLLRGIRSGETGYAWLIDGGGRFLYHPVTSYIGGNAFDVRERHHPDASYGLINEIQRDGMLRGLEGNSRYYSGQHRGSAGRIEKLIAYTPLLLHWRGGETWSLAVVAPVGDLDDALQRRSRWHLLLGGGAVGLVMLAGAVVLLIELRWRRRLKGRVIERTEDLRRSEDRYRSLVESSEDAIFTLDADYRIQAANSYSARFFKKRPSEVEGRPFAIFLPPEVAEGQITAVRRVLAGGSSVRSSFEVGAVGRIRSFDASYMPLRGRAGAAGVLCIARDVTEQRAIERHLAQTEKLASLGTLAAGFAHEINNPLTVMLGFCELMQKRAEPGTRLAEDLEIIERHGAHCRSIMDNLLSVARTENETTQYADLNRAVRETVQVVRHSLEMKAIEFDDDLAVGLPPVRGDFRQLQQVFLNLITNAVAAMPEGGRLTITTGMHSPATAEAKVVDTGVGIAMEHRASVFEPFFTTKAPGEGTGLGLFVSYGIVTKYGGDMLCDSRLDGEGSAPAGTTMTVRLPVQKETRP